MPAWFFSFVSRPTLGWPSLPSFGPLAALPGLTFLPVPTAVAPLLPRPGVPAGPRPALPEGAEVSVDLLRALPIRIGPRCAPPLANSRRAPAAGPSAKSAGDGEPAGLGGLLVEPPGAVGAAHQRAGQDPGETDLLGLGLEADELLGLDPPDDRVVPDAGPQVLGDRQQVAAGLVQRLHGLHDLVRLLAHAQDQVGLGDQTGLAGRGDDRQRAIEPEPGADPLEDAGDRLDVVRQHLRPGGEDLGQLVGVGVEVGDQQLDTAAGDGGVDLPDRLGVDPAAAVGQVVAGDAGDRGVAQAHGRHALGDPARLVRVGGRRLAGVDLAEVAAPGALVTTDEEGGLPVLPALVDVGAAGLLADRVQPLAADQRLQLGVLRAGLQPGLDPVGFALDGDLAVARLEAQEFAAARPDRRSRISGRYGRLRHDLHGTPDVRRPPVRAPSSSGGRRRWAQAGFCGWPVPSVPVSSGATCGWPSGAAVAVPSAGSLVVLEAGSGVSAFSASP